MAVERGNSNSSAFQLQINYTTGTGTFKINSVLGKRTDGYTSEGTLGLKVTVSSQNSNSSGLINTQTDTVTGYFGNGSWGGSNRWMFNGSNFGHNQVSGITASTIYVYITITSTFNSKIPVNSYWTFSTSITPVVTSKTVTIAHWTTGWQHGEGNNSNGTAYKIQDTTFSANPGSSVTFDSSREIACPRGFFATSNMGSGSYNNGTWASYTKPVTLTQPNSNTSMEYYYTMGSYWIRYDLNGGTNNANNPSTYTTPYGVTLQAPTRTGYTFKGWKLVYNVGDLALTAGSSDNYYWQTLYGNVQPGEDITIKISKATRTAGSSTYFTIRMYDFTSSADINSIVNSHCEFGSDQQYHFIAPSTIDGTHDIAIIIYSAVSGSTANTGATFSGISVEVTNTTKINRGENITFSSYSQLETICRRKSIGEVNCIALWEQAEQYTKATRLPNTYTEIEYLESTGTQWIDSGVNPQTYNSRFIVEADLQYTSATDTSWHSILAAAPGDISGTWNWHPQYNLAISSSNNTFAIEVPSGTAAGSSGGNLFHKKIANQSRHSIKVITNTSETLFYVDGAMAASVSALATGGPNKTLYIFTRGYATEGTYTAASYASSMKLYSMNISQIDGIPLRKFIPCKRISDSKPGLYDLVNNVFYTNIGTGEFTAGPEVKWLKGKVFYKSSGDWTPAKKIYHKDPSFGRKINLSLYTPLSYIASGSNQGYTNLNFSDAEGVKVIGKVQFASLANNYGTLCGSQEIADSRSNGANALIMQLGTAPWLTWYCGTGSNKASHFELQYSPFIIEVSSIKGNSYMKIGNAIQYFDDNTTARGTKPLYLFALNNGGYPGYYVQGTIYWLKVYNHTGTLVRDLIPCKRKSDDIVGLYDIVNDYFYVTQSNGAFVGGSELSDWHEGRNE